MATIKVEARGHNFVTTIELVTEDCYKCGITFAMPSDFAAYCRRDKSSFHCPNGHSQAYMENEADRLKRELKAEKDRTLRLRAEADQAHAAVEEERKHHASTKGQLTKVRNRIQNGVCPECNRHFVNLDRHMHTKHAS